MARTMRQRVLSGIRFLTREYGKSWRKKINLETLNLGSTCECILAQTLPYTGKQSLSSPYTAHKNLLGVSDITVNRHGFDSDQNHKYLELTEVWKKELAK